MSTSTPSRSHSRMVVSAINSVHLSDQAIVWIGAALLLIVAFVSLRLGFDWRGPIDEEMLFLRDLETHQYAFALFDFHRLPPRFMQTFFMGLAYRLFDLNFDAYFLVFPIVYGLNATLLWRSLHRMLPSQPWLAFSSALLFLVYPADATRTDMTMLMIGQSMLFFLLAVYLLLLFDDHPDWSPAWWAALPVLILTCLLSYEQVITLVPFIPALLFLRRSPSPRKRSIALAAVWEAGIGLLILWRVYFALFSSYGMHHWGGGRPDLHFGHLLTSYFTWVRIGLLDSWLWGITLIRGTLRLRTPESRVYPLWLVAVIFVVVLTVGWLLIRAWQQRRQKTESPPTSDLRAMGAVFTAGVLITLLTTITAPLAFEAPLSGFSAESRFHNFPSLGMALMLAALIFLFARLIARAAARVSPRLRISPPILGWLAAAGITTFGVIWQMSITDYWQQTRWAFRANLWREIAAEAPGIEPDTFVVFVNPPQPWVLRGIVYDSSMLQLLYDDATLYGNSVGHDPGITSDIIFQPDHLEAAFRNEAPLRFNYDQVLFIQLSEDGEQLAPHVIECLPDDLLPDPRMGSICGSVERINQQAAPTSLMQQWLYRGHVDARHNPLLNIFSTRQSATLEHSR